MAQYAERRQHARYCEVPFDVYLKAGSSLQKVSLKDISLGGVLIQTRNDYPMYHKASIKIDIPTEAGKDSVYAEGMIWRIEADPVEYEYGSRYVAFKFTDISETFARKILHFLKECDAKLVD